MNCRMDRTKLNIGAYILNGNARDEAHIKDVRDCGIDFITCFGKSNNTLDLDLMYKYNVGVIQTGTLPGWWGGDGNNAGTMAKTNPIEKYEEAAKTFIDHPAIWGLDVGDEPSALDFPHYGKVVAAVNRLFPRQFPYLNLYPNYASVSKNNAEQTVNQLGTPTYAEHIEEYIKNVPTDYICYDYYMYSCSPAGAMENLQIVADACRRTGRSMWIVLQVNSVDPNVYTSLNRLRYQAYSAMAFGAENIIWACWSPGWWEHNVLDAEGNKTEQYDKLKVANADIHAIGPNYMKYRCVSTYFAGYPEGHADIAKIKNYLTPVQSFSTGIFKDVTPDAPVIAGQMTARNADGTGALFLCAADDCRDEHPGVVNVTFTLQEGYRAEITTKDGTFGLLPDENGTYHVAIPSCDAALVEAKY